MKKSKLAKLLIRLNTVFNMFQGIHILPANWFKSLKLRILFSVVLCTYFRISCYFIHNASFFLLICLFCAGK